MVLLNIFIQCQSQKNIKTMIPTIDNKYEKFEKDMTESRVDIKTENTYIIYTSANSGYGITYFYKQEYFSLIKNFYPSKKLENKGIKFNDGSRIGIWYYFDDSGKLIKEENTDEGYDFSPEKVVKYCEKNKINLPKGYHDSGFQTQVLKHDFEGKKVWKIIHKITDDKIEEITLDGKTGKELQRKVVPFHNS